MLEEDGFSARFKLATPLFEVRLLREEKEGEETHFRFSFLFDDCGVKNLLESDQEGLVNDLILFLSHFQHRIFSHKEYLMLKEMEKREKREKS